MAIISTDTFSLDSTVVNYVEKVDSDTTYSLRTRCNDNVLFLSFNSQDERDKFYKELVTAMGKK